MLSEDEGFIQDTQLVTGADADPQSSVCLFVHLGIHAVTLIQVLLLLVSCGPS